MGPDCPLFFFLLMELKHTIFIFKFISILIQYDGCIVFLFAKYTCTYYTSFPGMSEYFSVAPLAINSKIILNSKIRSYYLIKVSSDAGFHVIEDGRLFHSRPLRPCGLDC